MLFSDIWSENAALFERFVEIHSNPYTDSMALITNERFRLTQ